jgi:glycosyltransferase involved in cell wall biosynthesis
MDVSIIIPVYNTAKYLKRCVQSVIEQEEISKEIILVDDGSTDDSPSICDNYSEQYPYITTIHTKNSGPSTAKNIGFKKASGRYVAFIDSDDKVCKNMFAKMLHSGNNHNADIICCN